MCGIIGYIGDKNICSLLVNGLKKMEYRGYDSAGLCVSDGKSLSLFKKKGKISDFENDIESKNISGNLGIAHTRWATHGEPNEINAHPHMDCKNEIAIVHNGIIENFHSLKGVLEKEGHKIVSETDSEIIAHMIEKFYSGNLEEAVTNSLKFMEGAFGIAVMHKNENKIVVAKKGSPLIIGVGENEMFVSSDVTGVVEHTKRVIYLNDGDVAVIEKNKYSIKDFRGNNVDKKIYEIKWEIEQIEKSGFKHFMLKEIFEQPETIKNVLRGRINENKIKLTLDFDFINRIVIIACGTSWHSGLIGKYIIEKLTGIQTEVDYASEFRYRNPIVGKGDLVIAISQSGETADTLAALKEAKSKGANTIGIINVVGSAISREVSSGIYLHAGPEIGVASTKAFTSQIVALILLALFIKQKKGLPVDENLLEEINSLSEKIKLIIQMSEEIKSVAKTFMNSRNFLYLGRGLNFPVAIEGALKLKEISYIHAEGYPAAEMKHGPIALIDEHMPVVFLATNGTVFEKVLSNIEEVRARGGRIITITDRDDPNIKRLSDYIIKVPKVLDILSPIVTSIPLQLLAYYAAVKRGIDVDKPRNLAKSVTVE